MLPCISFADAVNESSNLRMAQQRTDELQVIADRLRLNVGEQNSHYRRAQQQYLDSLSSFLRQVAEANQGKVVKDLGQKALAHGKMLKELEKLNNSSK